MSKLPSDHARRNWTTGAVFALCYLGSGLLTPLVLPPGEGFASAVWPPAGIALAACLLMGRRALPWLVAGALALLLLPIGPRSPAGDVSVIVATGLALASALQALIGAYLIRRILGGRIGLEGRADVARFAAVAVICSLVGATLSTVLLLAHGQLAPVGAAFVWLTQWVGYSLGVLLFTAPILAVAGHYGEGWREIRWRVVAVLACGLLFVGALERQVNAWERDENLAEFRLLSQHLGDEILRQQGELQSFAELAAAVMGGANPVDRVEFARLARVALPRFKGHVQAVEWAPLIDGRQRASFGQQLLSSQGVAGISERDPSGRPIAALPRDHYLPVFYAEPMEGNRPALGHDLLSSMARRETAQAARRSGQVVASPPLILVQQPTREPAQLLIKWVDRGANGAGAIVVVLRMGDFLNGHVAALRGQLQARLTDVGSHGGVLHDGFGAADAAPALVRELEASQRVYRLETLPTASYLAAHRGWRGWVMVVGCLGLLSLLVQWWLATHARAVRIETLVNERTRSLEEARLIAERAKRLLEEAVRSIAQGFTIYDENDRLVLCNENYLQIYGTSRDLIVPGATFEDIVRQGAERGQYAAAIGRVDEWVAERVAQHQNARGEVIEQKLDDGRWLMIVEFRTPSGYIVGNRIDITQAKRAALALQDRNEQLATIFSLSPDGYVLFDQTRRVRFASPAFYRMTGLLESELIGIDEAGFIVDMQRRCVPTASYQAAVAPSPEVPASQDGKAMPRELIELATPARRVLEVVRRASMVGSVSSIVHFRDVTHETDVDRTKSEFLSMAAHELRTPMASVYGFSELLASGEDFGEKLRREMLDTILRQSELMASIINELLDLARIEARRGTDFVFEELDIGTIAREAIASYRQPAGRLPPHFEVPAWRSRVKADRKKLQQVLNNLLSNAYKYSPDGGDVRLSCARVESPLGNRVTLSVLDQGIGMSPEQVSHVFERFYRADTSGKIPGTGLGMSIVKEIIGTHGGKISIDSTPGRGTTVTIEMAEVRTSPEKPSSELAPVATEGA
ncbi:putative Histidine kinase [Rubrivivax sp. A210]|uniref:ATP-binding protein n=1 Tax=Rubrivivax sp. A210 TaxID=2772301 RepID=UPI0019182A95|nr:ATP-binding protein [Rubrivivax sp. A210]CAD5373433.1 putative Histidine kinase [Rubrivivax sp. A210]